MTTQLPPPDRPIARFALYWSPPQDSALARLGTAWLGRDATGGTCSPRPRLAGIDDARLTQLTASPRLYGLHATLKPPFALAAEHTAADLIAALEDRRGQWAPFTLPPLELRLLDGFLALMPAAPSNALQQLAAGCVEDFDPFRQPPSPTELTRRRASGLTPQQDAYLLRWGYPYVFDCFRFHVTLTERLSSADAALLQPQLADYFAPVFDQPLEIRDIALFLQSDTGQPFLQLRRFSLQASDLL